MKKIIASCVISLLLLMGTSYAQYTPTYLCTNTNVTSSTTPVTVQAPSWTAAQIYAPANAASSILCWPYTGTAPSAAPAGCVTANGVFGQGCHEITAGAGWSLSGNSSVHSTSALACVLESGSTAVKAEVCIEY